MTYERVTYRTACVITDEGDIATRDGMAPRGQLSHEMLATAWERALGHGKEVGFVKAEGKYLEALDKLQKQTSKALDEFISKSGRKTPKSQD